jgi:hypothetical protein
MFDMSGSSAFAVPDAPLQQSQLYATACAAMGVRTQWLDVPEGPVLTLRRRLRLLGEVALVSRSAVQLAPQGLRAFRRLCGARHLVVNAEDAAQAQALAEAGFWPLARPRPIAELPLYASKADQSARLKGKWRNRLRHARRQGLQVTITPMPPDPAHWLFTTEAKAARKLGYRPLPPIFVAALCAVAPSAGQLCVAHHGNTPVAAALIIHHGSVATYQIGWSSPAGRHRSAQTLLLWRAMGHFAQLGCSRLDLGLSDAAAAPGLARFKHGTGATIRPLGGTWLDSTALPRRPAWIQPATAPSPP